MRAQTHKAPTVSAAVRNAEAAARRAAEYSDNASAACTAAQHQATLAANHAADADAAITMAKYHADRANMEADDARLYARAACTCLLISTILLIITLAIAFS